MKDSSDFSSPSPGSLGARGNLDQIVIDMYRVQAGSFLPELFLAVFVSFILVCAYSHEDFFSESRVLGFKT